MIELGSADRCGITVRRSPDGAEQTRIIYDRSQHWIGIDTSSASLSDESVRDVRGGALHLASNEPLQLHIFIDQSVIEVFANGRTCMTARGYPTRPDSLGLSCFASGGTVHIATLDIWELGTIWR